MGGEKGKWGNGEMESFIPFFCCFEKSRGEPLTRLATLATLSPQGGEGCALFVLSNSWIPVPE